MDEKIMGIYQIRNIINGKVYIGSSNDIINKRWKAHKFGLRRNSHYNRHLQRAWNKYGENAFSFEIVEKVEQRLDLIMKEQWYLDNISLKYNVAEFADSPFLGKTHSEKTRRMISESSMGNAHWAGKTHKKETKKKISDAMSGENHPFFGVMGEDHPSFGRKHSSDSIEKMSHKKVGGKNPNSKLMDSDVLEMRRLYSSGEYLQRELADIFDVGVPTVTNIINRKRWTHI